MRVTFIKSDAMAERFPDERDNLTVEDVPGVQLTYREMRTTRDWPETGLREGDAFAALDGVGDWITFDKIDGRMATQSVRHWSDVVIDAGPE